MISRLLKIDWPRNSTGTPQALDNYLHDLVFGVVKTWRDRQTWVMFSSPCAADQPPKNLIKRWGNNYLLKNVSEKFFRRVNDSSPYYFSSTHGNHAKSVSNSTVPRFLTVQPVPYHPGNITVYFIPIVDPPQRTPRYNTLRYLLHLSLVELSDIRPVRDRFFSFSHFFAFDSACFPPQHSILVPISIDPRRCQFSFQSFVTFDSSSFEVELS